MKSERDRPPFLFLTCVLSLTLNLEIDMKTISTLLFLALSSSAFAAAPTKAICEAYTSSDLGRTKNNLKTFELNLIPIEESAPFKTTMTQDGVEFEIGVWIDWYGTNETPAASVQLSASQNGGTAMRTQGSMMLSSDEQMSALSVDAQDPYAYGIVVIVTCKTGN